MNSEAKVYLLGGGIGSLAATAFSLAAPEHAWTD